MSYERTAIAESAPAIPNAPAIAPMREERVVEPYRVSTPRVPTGQPDTVRETIKPEEPKAPEETVRLSPAAAAMARKEYAFRMKEQAVKTRETALAAREAEISQLKAVKAKLEAKDYSSLEEMGVDYNEYSEYQLNKLNGTDPTQEALKRLEGKLSDLEKNNQDQVTKQFEAAVNERKLATKQLLESEKSAAYPRIKKIGPEGEKAIVHHILETWEHDTEELSIEQAAKEVEEILTEKARKWAALLQEETAPAVTEDKKQLPPMKPALRTLTNQVTAGDLKRPTKSYQHMSDTERWAEARKRAEEKLQQSGR